MAVESKQLSDLTADDLRRCPLWYCPMDQQAEDEMTLRPVLDPGIVEMAVPILIRTWFEDRQGGRYLGYIFRAAADRIDHLQPTLFAGQTSVTFWNGVVRPDDPYRAAVAAVLPPSSFPLSYRTDPLPGISALSGMLDGLYFIDDAGAIQVVEV